MKKTLLSLVIAGALSVGPAQAQFAVFDVANFEQNLLTAARTLEQINNQVRQLQNQAQILANQARNLQSLDFSALGELRAALADSQRLIDQARGLAFEVSRMDEQFRQLYPEQYTAAISKEALASDARERWRNSLEALRTATQLQAQAVENFGIDEQVLGDLVARSQSASGQLQAVQATNQLLALQARQSIQAQQLQLAQDRATALEQARGLAVHAQARELRRRFVGDGVPYTPQRVEFYGD